MDLRHCRYFVAVAESENVSRAARRVRISQPAVSRQIHDLEEELGVKLFERVGRGVRLTSVGEDLLAHARKVLNEVDVLRDRARALHRGDAGVVHAGATPQALQRLFPAVIARSRRIMPEVDVRLTEGHPMTLLELVRRGDLHLALTTYQPELRSTCRPAGVISLFAVGRADRRRRESGRSAPSRRTMEVRALEDEPLLLLQRGFGSRDLFDAACRMARIRPKIFLESSAPATLLSLVKAGCGVAILPATVTVPRSGYTVQVLVEDGRPLEASLAVHWSPLRRLPPYAERFADELSAYSRKLFSRASARR